jgi:uncharacterized protein
MNNILKIEDIPDKGLEFEWNKGINWLQNYFFNEIIPEFQFKDPLLSHFKITKFNRDIFIEGEINTKLIFYCSRCLEKFYYSINLEIDKILVPYKKEGYKEEKELKHEDFEVEYYYQKIDLLETIKEQILLNIPYKVLCRKDCKGLCQKCGVNLNDEQCKCHINKEIDPRFAILKNIKI